MATEASIAVAPGPALQLAEALLAQARAPPITAVIPPHLLVDLARRLQSVALLRGKSNHTADRGVELVVAAMSSPLLNG
jgi:hypothetical protein